MDAEYIRERLKDDLAFPRMMGGLSKRELFASMALQSLITAAWDSPETTRPENLSETAVILADALINELKKEEDKCLSSVSF